MAVISFRVTEETQRKEKFERLIRIISLADPNFPVINGALQQLKEKAIEQMSNFLDLPELPIETKDDSK